MDPFVMANDAQFYAPGSDEASYKPIGGATLPNPIRVIRSRPDLDTNFGDGGRVILTTNVFLIRRSDVAEPSKGDMLAIGAARFNLLSDAMLDVEGLTWRVGATVA